MRTKLRGRFALLFVACAVLLAIPAMALADVITNTLEDNTVDTVAEEMPLTVGSSSGTTTIYVLPTNTKDFPDGQGQNCNLNGDSYIELDVTSSNTNVATVSPATLRIDDCGQPLGKSITVAPVAEGTATITVSRKKGTEASAPGTFYYTPATFIAKVSPPPNTAPTVTVGGVTGGASYNKGEVPNATCNVIDKEDGNSSFAATLSSVSGTYASDGLGLQTASCSYTDKGPGTGLTAKASETYSIVDPSGPVITKDVTPGTPDGSNGWYKSDVTVDWTVSDPQSPNSVQKNGCNDQNITSDQQATTYNCSATSAGGSAAEQSVNIKRDATAPTNIQFVGGPAAGSSHPFGNVPNEPTCTATDATSTVDSCVVSGYSNAVGDHTLTATATDKAGNRATATRTYTVTKATAQVNLSDLTQTYNGSPRAATVATVPANLNVDVTYDGKAQAPTNAGSYAVVATVNNANYQGSASGTLKIEKAAATVNLSNLTHTYDGTVKAASASTTPTGLNVDFAYSQDGSAATPKNAGDYRVVATVNNANYQGSASGTLSIARADQAISFGALANKTFGDANFNVSATGGASGNDVTFKALDKCTVVGNTVQITGAGICTVTASQAGNTNYNAATDVSHSFRIAKATTTTTLTCGVGPFTYDGSAQTPCEATVKGFNLNAPVTVDYENNVNAGTATASASYAGAANYEPSSSGQKSFTIEKRAITVTADAQSKTYGEADPALTYKVTSGSLANANDLSGSLTRVAGQDVGTYAIQQGSLAGSGNYQITFVGANLTIEKRAITVTADAQSKTYGEADPALTYQVGGRGLVNGDSLSGSLDRAAGENFGTYAIRQGTLAASNNYSLTYVGANLTIGKAPITLKANDASRYYDDPNPAFGYSIVAGSFKNGDLGNGVSVELNTLATATSQAGSTHNITVALSGAKASNYSLTAQNGTLTILGWTNKGFFAPVDYGTTQNTVKNGSTVPLKFQVFKGTQQLTSTNIVSGLKPSVTNCQTGVPVDDIEELATGGTSLRYDATAGQFIFNWQTPKKPGTCYSVTVQMVDGTTVPVAKFWLK